MFSKIITTTARNLANNLRKSTTIMLESEKPVLDSKLDLGEIKEEFKLRVYIWLSILGGLILCLIIVLIVACFRRKAKKQKDAEKTKKRVKLISEPQE